MPVVIILCLLFALYSSSAAAQSAADANASLGKQEDRFEIKQIDENVRVKLKDLADSAHHLQKTVHEIIFEITRQEYVNASEPEVVGPIVIPAIPPPTGVIAMGGFFPPRKKYIDFYADQARDLLMMLSEEGSSLPDKIEGDEKLNAELPKLKKALEDLRQENDSLQNSMMGPTYNNLAIGKQAVKVSDQLDQIQKLIKDCQKNIHIDLKQFR
jgi:hypothetical protein